MLVSKPIPGSQVPKLVLIASFKFMEFKINESNFWKIISLRYNLKMKTDHEKKLVVWNSFKGRLKILENA